MALNAATAPRAMREVWFEVKDSHERPRSFLPKIEIGPPKADDVIELAPGASLTRTWNLAESFDLGEPEDYWIRVHYGSAPLADAKGRAVWSRPLEHGWAIVKVER
jgi:hypothetical protein